MVPRVKFPSNHLEASKKMNLWRLDGQVLRMIREALHFLDAVLYGTFCEEENKLEKSSNVLQSTSKSKLFQEMTKHSSNHVNCQTCWHVDALPPFVHDSLVCEQCGWIAMIKGNLNNTLAFLGEFHSWIVGCDQSSLRSVLLELPRSENLWNKRRIFFVPTA